MKHSNLLLIIMIFGYSLRSQSFQLGVLAKEELNIISTKSATDGAFSNQTQQMQLPAWGLGLWKLCGKHFGLNASVLLSRAYYNVNYSVGSAVFKDADIRFTQTNFNLEYYFSHPSASVRPYLFAGGQYLYRRFGTESFVNSVISNTYWPASRLFAQAGAGLLISDNPSYLIRPFIGIRYGMKNQLVYDKKLNQVFAGIAIAFAIKDAIRRPGSRCPDFF